MTELKKKRGREKIYKFVTKIISWNVTSRDNNKIYKRNIDISNSNNK